GAVVALAFVRLPPTALWPVLAASVGLHVGYKLCLSSAYANGELGEAFPLARGMVPLFATTIAFATLGQVPKVGQSLGIGLVSAGLLLVMLERQREPNWRLWAAAAGAGLPVAGYSGVEASGGRPPRHWVGLPGWAVS